MTDQPHTPTTGQVETGFALYLHDYENFAIGAGRDRFKAWLDARDARIEAAAEQRGAVRAFRKTQEIIAGFDHTIDEARNRDDMINTGYLIQKIDTEIQDLMEGDDETH